MKLLSFSSLALGALAWDESIFVVNNGDQIFRGATGNSLSSVHWTLLSGRLVDIGCNNNDECWGVNSAGQAYFVDASSGSNLSWTHKPANFKGVSVSTGQDGAVWVVDSNDQIWRALNVHSPWEHVNGLLVDIAAVSYYEAWGVNRQGQLWHQEPTAPLGVWKNFKSSAFLARVAVCDNGDVVLGTKNDAKYEGVGCWTLKNSGNAFQSWNELDGGAHDVACKNNNIYAIGGNHGTGGDPADHSIWVRGDWDPARNTYWNMIAGGAMIVG